MRRIATALILSLLVAGPALGWGEKGHRLVADVAASGLNPNARARVNQLLGGRTMAQLSMWADHMRTWQRNPNDGRPAGLANDPEAQPFFDDARNANQPNWHFVNLPIGTSVYRLGDVGTNAEDVVQILKRCINVLRQQAPPQENLSPGQALRLLIHFVGDLHQPLHAGCGYWLRGLNDAARLAHPAFAAQGTHDRGGNSLKYGNADFARFHIFWDGRMVDVGQGGRTRAEYLAWLISLVGGPGSGPWTLPGDPLVWPEDWAVESAWASDGAYRALDYSGVTLDTQRNFGGRIKFPAQYESNFRTMVDTQLARAGFRLAALLNNLWP